MSDGPFFRPNETQPFAGRRFYRDLFHRQSENIGDVLTHKIDVRGNFGTLQNHGGIDVDNRVPMVRKKTGHMRQEKQARDPLVSLVGIRKVLPDVAQGRRAQQCVRDRMNEHVSI
jgi:hypothetical protein